MTCPYFEMLKGLEVREFQRPFVTFLVGWNFELQQNKAFWNVKRTNHHIVSEIHIKKQPQREIFDFLGGFGIMKILNKA